MSSKLQIKTTRWAFDLNTWSPTLTQLTQAVAAIQPEERARLLKFYFINDFLSSLVGRLLMRKYVSQCSHLPYHEVQFARDARGKPYWVQTNNEDDQQTSQRHHLCFNVSHQGNFVILAGMQNVSSSESTHKDEDDFGIGCDVMKLEYAGGKDLKEFFRIMNRKFADSEWRFINQPHFNQQQQLKAFMRHWCLKESYVKELGVGITIDLQKIAFTVDSSRELLVESPPLSGTTMKCNDVPMFNYYFEEHMLHPKYCAAIAFRNYKPEKVENFTYLKIDELLRPNEQAESPNIVDYCREVLRKPMK
ncbi:L-aminoadipate-semialdehyde dehydrogenase-phosphopantetheinyl transferase [Musca domestica]|uniref:L-aminoadipate-semialdehyde dehydrogenase-phosphopantetheinyl transferase n=1 Tax=Musca domestica TaxID=7370 RepID=A0A1I8M112_MUSDO|nr:L-aminoadipate-semialdehyde dehydrogenase-phosphopantetheinyl transferase [Musca domestica]